MNTKPTIPLSDALDQIAADGATDVAFARVAYSTGWPVGKLEAAYDRRYGAWLADNGYDPA